MNHKTLGILLLTLFMGVNLLHANEGSKRDETQVSILWQQGKGKYRNYRIPSMIATSKGSLLAFCEGREGGDSGDIDILLKRSTDGGLTWSEEQLVWDDKRNTCGNPCPVIDEKTGRIWLILTWNNGKDHETEIIHKKSRSPRLPYICYSDDDGLSWSEPVKMSDTSRDPSWGWYATGPGIGVQVKNGPYKGRLVIPANHSYDDPKGEIRNGPYNYGAHVLYSDNQGKTWTRSESIQPGCNESQVVELFDGTLLMNMRSYNDKNSRAISMSKDGGATWSAIKHDMQLVESQCQASVIHYGNFMDSDMYFFSNPAVPRGRSHMTINISTDDCQSWGNSKLIYGGPSAYSCLTTLPEGRVGLFFEGGKDGRYEKMIFVSFPAKSLFTPGGLLSADDL